MSGHSLLLTAFGFLWLPMSIFLCLSVGFALLTVASSCLIHTLFIPFFSIFRKFSYVISISPLSINCIKKCFQISFVYWFCFWHLLAIYIFLPCKCPCFWMFKMMFPRSFFFFSWKTFHKLYVDFLLVYWCLEDWKSFPSCYLLTVERVNCPWPHSWALELWFDTLHSGSL